MVVPVTHHLHKINKEIVMTALEKLPLGELTKIGDLIEFEGPVLSHFKNEYGLDILFYWVDNTSDCNTWLVFIIPSDTLDAYCRSLVSLKTVVESITDDQFYLVDINERVEYTKITKLAFNEINPDYLPEEKSYYFQHF